jgi:hypothetical protein
LPLRSRKRKRKVKIKRKTDRLTQPNKSSTL